MVKVLRKIFAGNRARGTQGGFTLIEAVVTAGLTALVVFTLYVGLSEGAEVSRDVIKQQDLNRSLNNALIRFSDDMQGAVHFWSGTTVNDDNEEVLDTAPHPRDITFAIQRTDKSLAWIKYELVTGVFSGDTYLIRLSDYEDPADLALTYVAQDVANILFVYYDSDGLETDDLTKVAGVKMAIIIDTGIGSSERSIFVKLRNENLGLMIPGYDFESERDSQLYK